MKEYKTERGISFGEAMFLLFLGLRLTGHINWAWWLIAMPLLAQMLLAVVAAALVVWLRDKREHKLPR